MIEHTSAAGRQLVEGFEGFSAHAYQHPGDLLTIGYGHTNQAGGFHILPGAVITRAQADEILAHDLLVFEPDVREGAGKFVYNQHQFDACVSLAFNLGGPRFRHSLVADRLRAGDVPGAAAAFMRYTTAGGRFNQGLANRRHAEVLVFTGHGTHARLAALIDVHADQDQPMVSPDGVRA